MAVNTCIMLTIPYAKKVFEIAIPYYMYIQRVNFCCNKIPHDCTVFAENYIVCTLSSPMKNEKKKLQVVWISPSHHLDWSIGIPAVYEYRKCSLNA